MVKRYYKWILCLGAIWSLSFTAHGRTEIDSLLQALDQMIQKSSVYSNKKAEQLGKLSAQLDQEDTSVEEKYGLYDQLFEAYRQYRFDSALYYVQAKLELSQAAGRREWIQDARLKLSALLTSAGMYKESIDNLKTIDKDQLPAYLLAFYYHNYKQVYESLSEYASDDKYAPAYDQLAKTYQDSLLKSLQPGTNGYEMELGVLLMKAGKLEEAAAVYRDLVEKKVEAGSAVHAGVTATLAYIYGLQDKTELQKKYRILSAMSDIKAAVKENASLTDLAIQLYQEGDISRANAYIEHALEDANFYNARQRKVEISEVYPIISGAYQMQVEHQNDRLGRYSKAITIISVLLGGALIWIYWQMRRLARARRHLHEANQQLQSLNQQLKEANFVKEEYIGHFLNQCSVYIEKLENYLKVVRKNALAGRTKSLVEISEPNTLIQSELKEFYHNFDTAFLQLYPNFVHDFNDLLKPDQRINLKKGELLTTELRIFALIRLGINDSNKIAHFLRYSVNTIYNYRAQIKNKSVVERELFEDRVLEIGTFKQ
ncbi:MAG: DUF6377 domain-containing protein [Saprospiraceae bacterium]|nr:hypothetical protein [Lewinella sp.]